MADDLARQFAQWQIDAARDELAHAARRLASDAALYSNGLNRPVSAAGDARRLVEQAIDVAQRAARLDAITETVGYLAPDPKEQQ